MLRYDLGTRYTVCETRSVRVTPTLEFIGWTVLGGRQSRLGADDRIQLQNAAGVTVVNVKVGARFDFGNRVTTYAGLGHAITGESWYRDELRLELRWLF